MKMTAWPSVSIIVPVLNREESIRLCLESLIELNYPDYEIIVVDNGSTDSTRQIVASFPVKLLQEKSKGAYLARNRGIDAARGEIIAFTDSDCLVNRNWLRNLVRHYVHEKTGATGGNLLPYSPCTITEEFLALGKLRIFHSSRVSNIGEQANRFLSNALGSANMSFRKSVLKTVKGFNSRLPDFGGDYDLTWRVKRAGYNVVYDPEAIVYHRMRDSVTSMLQQFYTFGRGLPHLLAEQPGNHSYFQVKTYLFPVLEFKCRLPIRALITLDFLNLLFLGIILTFFLPCLLPYTVGLITVILAGALYMTAKTVEKTRKIKWFILFPLLHFLRNYAFTAGKFVGGIKYKVFVL